MMKTAQATGLLTRNKFLKRFYHFDKVKQILRVFDIKNDRENVLK